MRAQELLSEAIAAAPACETGVAALGSGVAAAEQALQTARLSFAEVEAQENKLIAQRRTIEQFLKEIEREFRQVGPVVSREILTVVKDPKISVKNSVPGMLAAARKSLSEAASRRQSLIDQIALLHSVLEVLADEALVIEVRKLQAEIVVKELSGAWLLAAGRRDVLEIHVATLPALELDPSLSVEVGQGSKAAQYALAISSVEMETAELRAALKQAEVLASQLQETL